MSTKNFILKVVAAASVLSIVLFFAFGRNFLIPIGICLGTFLSLYKIRTYRKVLGVMALQEEKSTGLSLLAGGLHTILPFMLLFISAIADFWLFLGVAAGLLVCVIVIIINIITENLGLTHNGWVGWF